MFNPLLFLLYPLFVFIFIISVGHLLFSCLDQADFKGHDAPYRLDAYFLHKKSIRTEHCLFSV